MREKLPPLTSQPGLSEARVESERLQRRPELVLTDFRPTIRSALISSEMIALSSKAHPVVRLSHSLYFYFASSPSASFACTFFTLVTSKVKHLTALHLLILVLLSSLAICHYTERNATQGSTTLHFMRLRVSSGDEEGRRKKERKKKTKKTQVMVNQTTATIIYLYMMAKQAKQRQLDTQSLYRTTTMAVSVL